jgi:hypothetical protein
VNVIWEFSPSKSTLNALKKLDSNIDGVVTLQEFVLLCKHHSDILAPVRKVRTEIQKASIFTRFWTDLRKKRLKFFGTKNILDLRSNPLDLNFPQLSMDYLNLRTDMVPSQYIEQYKLVQKKKAQSYKGLIEIPFELLDEMRISSTQTNGQSVLPPDLQEFTRVMAGKVQPRLGVYPKDSYAI